MADGIDQRLLRLIGPVRRKLLIVVVVCVLPTVGAAIYRAQEAQRDLLLEITTRLDSADEAFGDELDEVFVGSRLALRLVASDPRLVQDLLHGDFGDTRRLVAAIGNGTPDSALVVASRENRLVAASGAVALSPSLDAELKQVVTDALSAHSVDSFVQLRWENAPQYALVSAEPVIEGATVVGVVMMLKPVDSGFLNHAKRQLGSEWALHVNHQLVAQSDGHPAAAFDAALEGRAELHEANGHSYAINISKPPALQRAGLIAVVTASQDVTDLKREVWGDFGRSMFILTTVLIAAIALASWLSSVMVSAIRRIATAADALRSGQYALVEDVTTGDELEGLANAFNTAVAGLRERDRLKDTFGKYVTRQVADQVLQGKAVLGGEIVPVTVFFADIRGFTTISEKMEPKALLDFLNLYFSGMVESVMRHSGVVDKFIGDAIMAVFGAPVPHPDDALRAVRAALDMRSKLKELNAQFASKGLPEIRIGLGMHSGLVVAGNMGHADRMEYTVIGDPVNLASRLESLTKELGVDIVMSEDTYLKVKDHVQAEPLQTIQVRGREQQVRVYHLIEGKISIARAS